MSRTISATNLAEINASHLHEVVLVELAFDTPIYVHSGVGTITYNANNYLGVGNLGSISNATESEQLRPTSLTLTLDGIDADHITEALDSGNYGDVVTLYLGYADDDGLVDDPYVLWKGSYEFASIEQGEQTSVTITVQHDLAFLDDKDGGRFTDEDQQTRYSGDIGLEFVTDMNGLRLVWGGRNVGGPWSRDNPGGRDPEIDEDVWLQ